MRGYKLDEIHNEGHSYKLRFGNTTVELREEMGGSLKHVNRDLMSKLETGDIIFIEGNIGDNLREFTEHRGQIKFVYVRDKRDKLKFHKVYEFR